MNFDDPLLNLATILMLGIIGGELLVRLGLPKVTGWIAMGVVLRVLPIPGLGAHELSAFAPFTDFVLGFVAFTVGSTLHIHSLRNAEKRLALLMLAEALVTPAVVLLALVALGGVHIDAAMLLAAIAIAGAPGTTIIVIREAQARGLLSCTLLAAVGLIDIVAIGVFTFCASWQCYADDWLASIHSVGVEFGLALAVGLTLSLAAISLTRRLVTPLFVGPMMVAVILGSWGLARALGTSSILACTFAGIALSNLQRDRARVAAAYLRPFSGVLFAGFYTIVGLHLDFTLLVPMVGVVLLYFCARLGGKFLSAFVAMSLSDVTLNVRDNLGLALLPHGGVAVGLIFATQADPQFADVSAEVAAIGLAALALAELIGPCATRRALTRAGEVDRDRPRLLGFLEEQRIVHGIEGDLRTLIETLADRLYATTAMPIPKQQFVAAALARESEASTCLGRGLAIPHVVIPDDGEICGVLGLSAEGLDLGADDGEPVHAIMLLATPESERQRHLEILATTARALLQNRTLREQLYFARSAAQAYDVLNSSEQSEELNYFFDNVVRRIECRRHTASRHRAARAHSGTCSERAPNMSNTP